MSDIDTAVSELQAKHLTKHFKIREPGHVLGAPKVVRAVDDVSLELRAGEVTAVVGESGSGKSVLARLLARIVVPTSGELLVRGTPLAAKARRSLAYASDVQLVLQDPFGSMNPVHKISHNLFRPLSIHGASKDELRDLAGAALQRVSLDPPERYLDRFPYELSGGQLQRVSIARALCVKPKVLLADEPISMLDVSVRLGVLNLLRGLCDNEHLAILYITHDIASARYLAEEIIVMYAGQVVEHSRGTALVDAPTHPYTQLLISSVPDASNPISAAPDAERHNSSSFAQQGCRFSTRCTSVMDICRTQEPPSFVVGESHTSKCWLYRDRPEASVELAIPKRRGEGAKGRK
jgi:peptide/nickel transport system ATP-binding protein